MLPNLVSAEINVTLESPQDKYIFNNTNNVTFSCNMSTGGDPSYIELYSNINGSFSKTGGKYLKGLDKVNGTVFLMHFNNDFFAGENENHVYDWSGNGNNGTVNGVEYNSSGGKFYGAYEFNGSDNKITIGDSNNLDLVSEGSIEFWMKVRNVAGSKDRVIMKGNSWGGGFPYSIYLGSGVRVYVWLENSDTEVMSSVDLNYNEWYHIVATWNSSDTRLYINGSLDNSGGAPVSMFSNDQDLEIGGKTIDWGSEGPFNGTLDDLALYNRALTPSEVSEHYNSDFENITGAEWNVSYIEDGSHSWNCLAYDNETSNWSSVNYTLHIDLQTPPSVNSITFSPSSEDYVDPGVTIGVTANITDISNVNSAVFQYKRSGVSTWDNITMNNISPDEWNASFAVSSPPDIWDYRIWSNDTLGHSGYSQQYNISADYEYSWALSPENLGEKYVLYNKNGSPGVLVINNTGDYPLNFKISSSFAKTYFNVSNPNDFDVSAKGKEYVNINVTAPSEPGEYQIQITVNATSGNADPSEWMVNATVISYWGGPYLTASIVGYESIVQQSTGWINYSAKVRNIGNETATYVWINWTLPPGWSNISGNLNYFAGNLSNGSAAFNNITVYLSSSANAQVSYLYVYTGSSNNSTANTSIQVSVTCSNTDGVCGTGCSYVTDSDCSPPSGDGTAGTYTVYPTTKEDYNIILVVPSRFDINRGETKVLSIGVENKVKNTELNNVYLSLSGYPQTFIIFPSAYPTKIGYGETKYFDVGVKAPIYAVYKEYVLNVTVNGEFLEAGNLIKAHKSVNMLLVTHRVVENETIGYFESAWKAFEEMNESGFKIKQVSEMLKDIEKALDGGNYDKVKELSEDVVNLRNLAFKLRNHILEMEKNIENAKKQNFKLPETEKMLFLANSAFHRGEYERAEERMGNAMLTYAIEMGSVNLWIFIQNYWWLVLTVILVSGTGILRGKRRLIIGSLMKTLDYIVEEEKNIKELVADLQKQYFERKIGFEKYSEVMEGYENGLVGIRKERVDTLSKLTRMIPKRSIEILKGEEERVKNLIAETQKKYFYLGKMGKGYYDKMIEGLKTELFEIQKQMEIPGSGKNV